MVFWALGCSRLETPMGSKEKEKAMERCFSPRYAESRPSHREGHRSMTFWAGPCIAR